MALFETGERTEPATPRKRQEARERGQVARSQDLTTALVLLAACLALHFLGPASVQKLRAGMAAGFQELAPARFDLAGAVRFLGSGILFALGLLAPFLAVLAVAGTAANFIQVGFLASGELVSPDPGRLHPARGLQRIFSLRGLFRGSSGVLKIAAVGAVLVYSLWSDAASPRGAGAAVLLSGSVGQAASYVLEVAAEMGLRAAAVLLVLAILDYGFQRWIHERDLRMTKGELQEELRRMEGDPKVKERRRRVQEQLAGQRMMQDVPKATVVVTDHARSAVALRYAREEMAAPRVLAKGEGSAARRIREIALEHGVPLVERAELARALSEAAEVGREVPPDLYRAVAEILAFVCRMTGRRGGAPGGGGRAEEPATAAGAGGRR